jgi:hypothetical protein
VQAIAASKIYFMLFEKKSFDSSCENGVFITPASSMPSMAAACCIGISSIPGRTDDSKGGKAVRRKTPGGYVQKKVRRARKEHTTGHPQLLLDSRNSAIDEEIQMILKRCGILLAGWILIVVLMGHAQAANYYIDQAHRNSSDTNPGTAEMPWKTIQKANQTLRPGDTVFIRAGTYSGQIIQPGNSGTSDTSRIIYTAYPGEEVEIRNSAYGIYLQNKSFITVNGIRFYNLQRFFRIYAGHYNIISYCTFDQRSSTSGDWAGARIGSGNITAPNPASEPSTHNWVHHCSFTRWVYGAYAENRGALLDIGNNLYAGDKSSYNLVEDCTFAYGGHHTLGVYSPFNVIRRNYFHNETNPSNWSHKGYRSTITEGPAAGWTLYEGNRFGHSEISGMALRSQRNIFRFNLFYHTGQGAIQVVSNAAGVDRADHNRIYHNTFYNNGHLSTYANFQGGMYFANWGNQSPVGNVVKNNIFFSNKRGSITYEGRVDPQIIANNWDQNHVNPGFVNLTDGGPNNPLLPDLRLTAGSPAIDQGTSLTTVASASGTGTSFRVADAGYFMDGWGVTNVQGDMIRLLGSTQRARITKVDYQANTIQTDRSLTWVQGQGIALSYEGEAPDLGAYEYGARSDPQDDPGGDDGDYGDGGDGDGGGDQGGGGIGGGGGSDVGLGGSGAGSGGGSGCFIDSSRFR